MLKCKNCGERLTKFDKEMCPYCGTKNPIENMKDSSDTTQTLDKILSEDSNYSIKSYKLWLILMMCLGMFSADLFYLKKYKNAIIRLSMNIIIFLIFFLSIYLSNNSMIVLAILLPIGFLFLFYLALGLFFLVKNRHPKDSDGVYLK